MRRAPLLGLGATAAPQPQREKRFIKPGESREAKRDMVVYDKDGNIKHTRTADDKLVERVVKGPSVGKTMRILSGRHSGLLCTVTAIHPEVCCLPSQSCDQGVDPCLLGKNLGFSGSGFRVLGKHGGQLKI